MFSFSSQAEISDEHVTSTWVEQAARRIETLASLRRSVACAPNRPADEARSHRVVSSAFLDELAFRIR